MPADNLLIVHGPLRVCDNRRYLCHADGTPFFWLADTGWDAFWNLTSEQWKQYVQTRRDQRFSVLQIHATRSKEVRYERTALDDVPFDPDGRPRDSYWHEVRDRIRYANEQGLYVFLCGVGRPQTDWYTQMTCTESFAEYLTKLLDGCFVVYSPSMDIAFDERNDQMAAWIKRLAPKSLVMQHPRTDVTAAERYHASPHTDAAGLQTGHHNGNLASAYRAAIEWPLRLYRLEPVKPVINIEGMYDGYGRDDGPNWRQKDVRRLGWMSILSGSIGGYSYAAGDIHPKVPTATGGVWGMNRDTTAWDHWTRAIHWPSAGHMTHLRAFFTSIEWWRLAPDPNRIANQSDEPQQMMALATSRDGDLLLAYLPDNPRIEIDLTGLASGLRARWFDPVTGKYIDAAQHPTGGTATFTRPENLADAALVLQA